MEDIKLNISKEEYSALLSIRFWAKELIKIENDPSEFSEFQKNMAVRYLNEKLDQSNEIMNF